jgi:hypothetical protein
MCLHNHDNLRFKTLAGDATKFIRIFIGFSVKFGQFHWTKSLVNQPWRQVNRQCFISTSRSLTNTWFMNGKFTHGNGNS